jgi:hypothetical protein
MRLFAALRVTESMKWCVLLNGVKHLRVALDKGAAPVNFPLSC